jgi:hypothetical protein
MSNPNNQQEQAEIGHNAATAEGVVVVGDEIVTEIDSNVTSNIAEVVKLLEKLETFNRTNLLNDVQNYVENIKKYANSEIHKGLDEIDAVLHWCAKIKNNSEFECAVSLKDKAIETQRFLETKLETTTYRIAPLDFGIKGTEMSYTFDFVRFEAEVHNLFQWFEKRTMETIGYSKFIAPYFPLIQSSGTGKTFLLYNLKKTIDRQDKTQWHGVICKLLVCGGENDPGSPIHEFLNVEDFKNDKKVDAVKVNLCLDKLIKDCDEKKIVLLFDEAQHLLEDDNALLFRMVRWWLRIVRTDGKMIVAVFTGTTSKLSNYYPLPFDEPPLFLKKASDSRNGKTKKLSYYNDRGTQLEFHPPFGNCKRKR